MQASDLEQKLSLCMSMFYTIGFTSELMLSITKLSLLTGSSVDRIAIGGAVLAI
jgi:hypothetical protein